MVALIRPTVCVKEGNSAGHWLVWNHPDVKAGTSTVPQSPLYLKTTPNSTCALSPEGDFIL